MKTASRTLVKSPPEVWERLDHPERMQGLMSALVGHTAEIHVYEREEESKLAWKADDAWIKVEIAEKGWGTNVSVSAENGKAPTMLEGWLDAVLDELATPTKRPFQGMTEGQESESPPAEAESAATPPTESEPVEEEPVEPEPVEKTPVEPAPIEAAQTKEASTSAPRRKMRRRFFRF